MSDQTQQHQSHDNYQRPSYNKKPKFPWFKTIIVALIAGIIGALLVLGIGKVLNHTVLNHDGASVQEVSNSKGGNQLDGKSDKYKSVHDMIKDVSPAIVELLICKIFKLR